MKKKLGIPKGTRDFDSIQLYKRNYIIDLIKDNFLKFGFNPIETPSFERSSTLLGKYGDEGSKLIFKVLSRGEAGKRGETDLALRYDLTVPLARVVAMNPSLNLPFKRYQIQPVWRADRPHRKYCRGCRGPGPSYGSSRDSCRCADGPASNADCPAAHSVAAAARG